jgi:Transposase DDE domain
MVDIPFHDFLITPFFSYFLYFGNPLLRVVQDLSQGIQGLLIGDKGYLSADLKRDLDALGIKLQTPLRRNMKETRPLEWVHLQQRFRRLIETVNSQLSERFHFERIRCRDLWHLISRVNRKILAHTLCCWLNHKLGRELLQFDGLVCDA